MPTRVRIGGLVVRASARGYGWRRGRRAARARVGVVNLMPPAVYERHRLTLRTEPLRSGTTYLGYGTMPADIVEGRQAQDIAAVVSAIAGHP